MGINAPLINITLIIALLFSFATNALLIYKYVNRSHRRKKKKSPN